MTPETSQALAVKEALAFAEIDGGEFICVLAAEVRRLTAALRKSEAGAANPPKPGPTQEPK